jgi:hypothetical protein
LIDQIHGEHKYYLHLKVKSVKKEKEREREKSPSRDRNILTKESKPERIKASHRLNPNYTLSTAPHFSISGESLAPGNRDQGFPRVSIKEGNTLPFTKSPLMLATISSSEKNNPLYSLLLSVHLFAN